MAFDGSPDAIASVKTGALKATVLQTAALMARTADQAHRYITSRSTGPPAKQAIDCELITPKNAHDFRRVRS